jgi:hypothetical protein
MRAMCWLLTFVVCNSFAFSYAKIQNGSTFKYRSYTDSWTEAVGMFFTTVERGTRTLTVEVNEGDSQVLTFTICQRDSIHGCRSGASSTCIGFDTIVTDTFICQLPRATLAKRDGYYCLAMYFTYPHMTYSAIPSLAAVLDTANPNIDSISYAYNSGLHDSILRYTFSSDEQTDTAYFADTIGCVYSQHLSHDFWQGADIIDQLTEANGVAIPTSELVTIHDTLVTRVKQTARAAPCGGVTQRRSRRSVDLLGRELNQPGPSRMRSNMLRRLSPN